MRRQYKLKTALVKMIALQIKEIAVIKHLNLRKALKRFKKEMPSINWNMAISGYLRAKYPGFYLE